MNIFKHVIKKKIHDFLKKINVKWTLKDKIYNNHVIYIYIYIYIWKVSMHFTNKLFI
jgi:hypothetical protein